MNLIVKCYRENLHLLLKGTVHQSKINYSPSCCSNSIWFVSPLEQKLNVLKNFHTAVRWLCVIDVLELKLHSLWSLFTSIVWKKTKRVFKDVIEFILVNCSFKRYMRNTTEVVFKWSFFLFHWFLDGMATNFITVRVFHSWM